MPLFARLSSAGLAAVVDSGQIRHVGQGETLFQQGDEGDRLYVVLDGALTVTVGQSQARLEVNAIQRGGYVGEIALLDSGPRSATVTATTDSELFTLSRAAFLSLLQAHPELLAAVLAGLTQTVRSATERVAREKMLRAEMELARHRALTEMVAGVAHEINTPLGVVRTAASLLSSRLRSGSLDDAAEASELIERNIVRAHRLIEDFKRLSVSHLSDVREELDIVAVVEEVIELFSLSAAAAGLHIDLRTHISGSRTWLGYRGRLSQVLLNLLSNVERYAYPDKAGGAVTIDLGDAPDGFIIAVADQGRGIQEADLPRVFEPFFTTGRARGGSGLGLAIVRNIVHDGLGGTIDISSQPGVGTTVTVRLPRTAPEPG